MQAYDLIMLIVLSMATIFGAIKGFAWQVASIASVIVSYLVAYNFRYEVADMIQAKEPWNLFLAMLLLYVGTSFAIWVGFRIFSSMIDRVRLKEFDRHLGAGFGFAKGLVYCLLITMFAMSLLGETQQRAICQSKSGFFIASALDRGVGILPQEVHDVVGPYLAELDDKLKNGRSGQPATSGLEPESSLVGGLKNVLADQISDQIPSLPEGVSGVLGGLQNAASGSVPAGSNFAPVGGAAGQPVQPGGQAGFGALGAAGSEPRRFASQPNNPSVGNPPASFHTGRQPASFSTQSNTQNPPANPVHYPGSFAA